MIHALEQILQKEKSPTNEAMFVAGSRVANSLSPDEQQLMNLLKVIELGATQLAHFIDLGCKGDATHMRAYGIMSECWEFLFARGITRNQIDKVVEMAAAIDDAIRSAG